MQAVVAAGREHRGRLLRDARPRTSPRSPRQPEGRRVMEIAGRSVRRHRTGLAVPRAEHKGETGVAWWRTPRDRQHPRADGRYSPGYLADHWCSRGHVLLVLEGEAGHRAAGRLVARAARRPELPGGRQGRCRTARGHAGGARLFIVD
ncbi:MAG: hypothetical protein MZV64_30850 [Ignavibacteriales bacterium]|nr:hypothetical protein [Ignavibacteriales bacterium]